MKLRTVWAISCLIALTGFSSCEKSDYEVNTTFNVRLSSAAYSAEQVNINIQKVQVNVSDKGWVDLTSSGEIFNVRDYQASDTLLANGKLPATSIVSQLRLVFGSNNSIKLDGKVLPLSLDSSKAEMLLTVNRKLNRSQETVTVVINPSLSVSKSAEDGWLLNPVATIQ